MSHPPNHTYTLPQLPPAGNGGDNKGSGGGQGQNSGQPPHPQTRTQKRRKVSHACVYCRRSHMTCDEGRPCQRCIKRSIGHLCHDEYKQEGARGKGHHAHGGSGRGLAPPAPLPSTPLTFASAHMGDEFSVLSDFLNVDHPPPSGLSGGDGLGPSPLLPTHQITLPPAPSLSIPTALPAPRIDTTEKYFLTAADPSDGTLENKLLEVINAKYEAGFLKPFNYVSGYTRLQAYMDSHMSQGSRQRILGVVGTFRPAFRAIAQSLTDIDLVLVEENFERLLLDYDRVFSAMGIPACLWRRTGEIYKANREFAELVDVPLDLLKEGRTCIYELMAEESAVNYWEKYGHIAFDAGQKAVLTSCLLKHPEDMIDSFRRDHSPQPHSPAHPPSGSATPAAISCCFSFTIRRDKYNIPTLIAGNFLPVYADAPSRVSSPGHTGGA